MGDIERFSRVVFGVRSCIPPLYEVTDWSTRLRTDSINSIHVQREI